MTSRYRDRHTCTRGEDLAEATLGFDDLGFIDLYVLEALFRRPPRMPGTMIP